MNPSAFCAKKGVVYRHLHVSANDDIVVQNYGTSSVSLDKLGLSELTPGPVTWNVEVFVQALKELVSA